jgi:hypothetical protein
MRLTSLVLAAVIVLAAGLPAAQDAPVQAPSAQPERLFVRWSIYPTASLSRYDYNNDVDLFEVRVYVEVRRVSQEGEAVRDAVVRSLGETLDFQEDHFEKRILLGSKARPAEVDLEIRFKEDRPDIKLKLPLPDWLVLEEPRPSVVDAGQDLVIRWSFDRFAGPVDILGYDFRTGKEFLRRTNEPGVSVVVPAADLPPSTIVRIYVIQSWLSKRYLDGREFARGSEVNFIPWSQVFIRTKGPLPGGRP